jgi:DNA-binding LacI/PurR family transcriptional regulator
MAPLLQWDDFAVVATTYGVLSPQFHRVVPHQFGNALLICRQLAALGCRRIGLVLPAEQDLRVHHGFSAAVTWHGMFGGTEFVRPCIHAGDLPPEGLLRQWFAREKPDAILAAGDKECRPIAQILGLSVPGPVAFASTTKSGRSVFAGVDELPAELAATAVEQLAAMIQRGEKGVPTVHRVTMIDGRWIDGRSTRSATIHSVKQRRRRSGAPAAFRSAAEGTDPGFRFPV